MVSHVVRDSAEGGPARQVDEVTGALERLATMLGPGEHLLTLLRVVCDQVNGAIAGTDFASISLVRDDGNETAAATDERAVAIDLAQYEAGVGPCLEAARTGQVLRVTVSEVGTRWPAFAAVAGDAAVASYLSAPLFIDSEYHGSFNLYGKDAHGFCTLDAALLDLYRTAVEIALRASRQYAAASATIEQLRTALVSRAVIDEAKGMLMAIRQISADEAFAVMVAESQATNTKVRDVAERLVARVIGP